MFDLDSPKTASGGNGKLPPTWTPPQFKRPDGSNNSSSKPANNAGHNNQSPVISQPVTGSRYPKPAAWVEKRIALCVAHHARFIKWRAANIARLQAWRESQPGYDANRIAAERYTAQLRRAATAKRARG